MKSAGLRPHNSDGEHRPYTALQIILKSVIKKLISRTDNSIVWSGNCLHTLMHTTENVKLVVHRHHGGSCCASGYRASIVRQLVPDKITVCSNRDRNE